MKDQTDHLRDVDFEASRAFDTEVEYTMLEHEEKNNFVEINEPTKRKHEPIDWFDEHYYLVLKNNEEVFYPSVTTILQVTPKPHLHRWRGNVGNEEADRKKHEGQERGRNVHDACETLSKGGVVKLHQGKYIVTLEEFYELKKQHGNNVVILFDQFQYLQAFRFKRFLEEVNPEQITTEQTVFSHKHRYAGTLDYKFFLRAGKYSINGSKPVELEEGWYIADLKSSNYLSPDNYLQLAAYWEAEVEQNGSDIIGALLIHTNASTRTGIEGLGVKLITPDDKDDYFDQFLKIYEVWKINPSPSAPKVFQMPRELIYKPINKEE